MNLFLDDLRIPSQVEMACTKDGWRPFPSIWAWEIVRSYDEFVRFIEKKGLPTTISFDHDLGTEHYPKSELDLITPIDYSKFKEKTGYDCAKWLVEYCLEKNLTLPDWYVHSFNPVGRMNIVNCLTRGEEIQKTA